MRLHVREPEQDNPVQHPTAKVERAARKTATGNWWAVRRSLIFSEDEGVATLQRLFEFRCRRRLEALDSPDTICSSPG